MHDGIAQGHKMYFDFFKAVENLSLEILVDRIEKVEKGLFDNQV